ncbi:MAG: hypothetical protein NVS2B5_10270 [Beijerinckiaceae bacterium]
MLVQRVLKPVPFPLGHFPCRLEFQYPWIKGAEGSSNVLSQSGSLKTRSECERALIGLRTEKELLPYRLVVRTLLSEKGETNAQGFIAQ